MRFVSKVDNSMMAMMCMMNMCMMMRAQKSSSPSF